MGFLSSIKNLGSKIYDGLKTGVNKVIDVGSSVRDGIKKGYEFVRKIPVLGSAVDGIADLQGPGGITLRKLAEKGSDALDNLKGFASGAGLSDDNTAQETGPPASLDDVPLKRIGRKQKGRQ